MADNSKFVLRWVINDATVAHAAERKLESEVFNEGGFKWIVAFEKNGDVEMDMDEGDHADLCLRCDVNHNKTWKCEAEVTFSSLIGVRRSELQKKKRVSFNGRNKCFTVDWEYWSILMRKARFNVNTITLEFAVNIVDAYGDNSIADPGMFAIPNNKSDVILKIQKKKLHVSKEYLAVQSPVFDRMFFCEFAEKGKEEVEIKDVIYDEFLDLLNLLGSVDITDWTVPHLLKLADRFQMERVLKLCDKHLKQSTGFNGMKKLIFADQYRLTSLKDHILHSFTNVASMAPMMKSPEYDNLSDRMKAAICDKIAKLI